MLAEPRASDGTLRAFRSARAAHLPPELHDAVAEIRGGRGVQQLDQNFFHPVRVGQAFGVHPEPPANADAVGVGYHRTLVKHVSEEQIRDLAAMLGVEIVEIL